MIDQALIVYALLAVVVLAFFREWAPPDVVALGAMMTLWAVQVLSTDQVLDVFSNSAPITVAAMFIMSAGLERSGCIDIMGRFFSRFAGRTELRVLIVMMLLGAVLSAFVNNTPVVVVFLPIVVALANENSDLKSSRLLIPLSFACILGGTCTLTGTSTNLIIDGAAKDVFSTRGEAYDPFTMFEVTKLGLIYAVIGFLYMLTIGRKLLPTRESLQASVVQKKKRHFLTQVMVEEGSPLIGKTLVNTLVKEFPEARILEVRRRGTVLVTPLDELTIEPRDRIRLTVHGASFDDFKKTGGLRFPAQRHLKLSEMETQQLQLMEGVIGPQSPLIGMTLRELRFRQRYGVLILAVHRKSVDLRSKFENVSLRVGDTLLLEGPIDGMNRLMEEYDFLILDEPPKREIKSRRGWIAAGIVVAFIIGASVGGIPISGLALLAAVLMLVTRCLEPKEAYGSVQWSIIFMIFGMLALGKAMETSGGAKQIADLVESGFGGASPIILLAVIYLMSSTLTELISNNAVAALLTPIVIGIASNLAMDARPFIVAIMFGCSASFATPIGYQTNTYVYGAGGYKFSDFPKVGVPLNLLLWIAATLLIPLLWPAGLSYAQWWGSAK